MFIDYDLCIHLALNNKKEINKKNSLFKKIKRLRNESVSVNLLKKPKPIYVK